MRVFPFPAPASFVAALYAATPTVFGIPSLIAAGDFNPTPVSVRGFVERETIVPLQDGATWRDNMRRIQFKLEEV